MPPILAHRAPPPPHPVEKRARTAWPYGTPDRRVPTSAAVEPPVRTRRDDDGSEE